MFFCCDCSFFFGRGLCEELNTRPEEFYCLWCFVVCDLETSRIKRLRSAVGLNAIEKEKQKTTLSAEFLPSYSKAWEVQWVE